MTDEPLGLVEQSKIPASIKYKNPGAMWGGARANKWGAVQTIGLNDGLGQGNNIAVFPTTVQGAAAQFDLWRAVYSGMSLTNAIKKWSGGNSSPEYVTFLADHTKIASTDIVTTALLAGPKGIALMRAQAEWEAGKPYPMTMAEWQAAQNMVFHGAIIPPQQNDAKPGPKAPVSFWTTLADLVSKLFKRNA